MEYILVISHRDLLLKMRSIPLTGISSLRSDIPSRLRRAVQIKREKAPSSKLVVLFLF